MKSHSDKKHLGRRYDFVIIIFLYIAFSIFTYISPVVHFDEKECHFPNLNLFYNSDFCSASTSPEYLSANTPLPYFLSAGLFHILNLEPSLKLVRIFNTLVSLCAFLLFTLLLKDNKTLIPSLILFFHPYFIKPSFLYFMSIYGLLFFLLFLILIRKNNAVYTFTGGVSLALAILCQQFYLIVIPFFFLYKLLIVKGKMSQSLTKEFALFVVPVLPIIPLFLAWEGLAHPNYQVFRLNFHFEYITGVILVIGSLLFPYIVFKIKEIKLNIFISVFLISILLSLFLFPVWSNIPMPGYISGFNFKVISKIEVYSFLLALILKVLLISSGLLGLVIFSLNRNKIDLFYVAMITAFILGFSISSILSERHMLPLIVLIYIIVFKFLNNVKYPLIWVSWQILLGGVYLYNILFVYKIPGG